MKKSIWKEVRNDFYDEKEGMTYIDAWYTDDDNEEGQVIAKIDDDANVQYLEDMAKDDPLAQEIINETRFEILARKVYPLYIADWCRIRGYNLDDRDEENGFNGEDFVCFEEFMDNEFLDEEYVNYLLDEDDFLIYKEIVCSEEE